ncbi:MAG: hypothetical protein ACK4L4_19810, partial [Gemmobacter sp.]
IPVNLKQDVARLYIVRSVHLQTGQELGHDGEGQTCVQQAGCAIVPGLNVRDRSVDVHFEVFQWGR